MDSYDFDELKERYYANGRFKRKDYDNGSQQQQRFFFHPSLPPIPLHAIFSLPYFSLFLPCHFFLLRPLLPSHSFTKTTKRSREQRPVRAPADER